MRNLLKLYPWLCYFAAGFFMAKYDIEHGGQNGLLFALGASAVNALRRKCISSYRGLLNPPAGFTHLAIHTAPSHKQLESKTS